MGDRQRERSEANFRQRYFRPPPLGLEQALHPQLSNWFARLKIGDGEKWRLETRISESQTIENSNVNIRIGFVLDVDRHYQRR